MLLGKGAGYLARAGAQERKRPGAYRSLSLAAPELVEQSVHHPVVVDVSGGLQLLEESIIVRLDIAPNKPVDIFFDVLQFCFESYVSQFHTGATEVQDLPV